MAQSTLPELYQAAIKERVYARRLRMILRPLDYFKNLDYQKLFEDCVSKIKGVFGGNRAGKTAIGAKYVLKFVESHPRSRVWVCAETEEISINIQQRKIYDFMCKEPGTWRYCYYDEINGFRNQKLVHKNGSMIRFKTYKQGAISFASDDIDLCLAKGTLILMADGSLKKIEDVQVGDCVVSMENMRTESGRKKYKNSGLLGHKIRSLRPNMVEWSGSVGIKPTMTIVYRGVELSLTHDHLVFISGRGWTEAINIQVGDNVYMYQSQNPLSVKTRRNSLKLAKVKKIKFDNVCKEVYDLKIERDHNFIANGICVHNCWNDEEPPYDIYREQRMRLIDRDGEMIFTMTSLHGVTELISEIYDDHEVVRSEWSDLLQEDLPRIIEKNGARFFMLWSTENPHINQERLREDIKVLSRAEIKSRICGVPVNLAGRIYPTMTKDVHVVDWDMVPSRLVTLYHILDPHDRKPWAMQWWAVAKSGGCYCIREYPWHKNFNDMEFDDKTYDEYVSVIRAVESELLDIFGRSVHRRIIDPNFGRKTIQLAKRVKGKASTTPIKELASRGLRFEDGIDALEAGHIQVRKMLHWEQKDGEIIVQPKFYWLDECENSIRQMVRYSWKDLETSDGDVKDKPQIVQKNKDFPDLTRYFAMSSPRYYEPRERSERPAERVY